MVLDATVMNVLLAEDDTELARQLLAELTESGYHVQVESDGKEGLEAALRGKWKRELGSRNWSPDPNGADLRASSVRKVVGNPAVELVLV